MTDISPQVHMLLDGFNRMIGINNRCRLGWLRTGGNVELIGGTPDFSFNNFIGKLGKLSLTCDRLVMPIYEPELKYERMANGRLRLTLACEVDLPGEQQKAGASPVGAIGIGSIIGLLSIAWSLLHPRVSLVMPADIELDVMLKDESTLVIDFVSGPKLNIVFGLQFEGKPYRATIQSNYANVQYKALIFDRTAEWSW